MDLSDRHVSDLVAAEAEFYSSLTRAAEKLTKAYAEHAAELDAARHNFVEKCASADRLFLKSLSERQAQFMGADKIEPRDSPPDPDAEAKERAEAGSFALKTCVGEAEIAGVYKEVVN